MEPEDTELGRRLAALEARVELLEEAQAKAERRPVVPRPAPARDYAAPAPRPGRWLQWPSTLALPDWSSEDWLSRIGITLLLFGLAFLFKYAIDLGWLTPLVRILFGAGLGAFLLVTGLRLGPPREGLAQILVGGGIATFYASVFAAYQLYGLLQYPVAFALMVGITAAAFWLAGREDQPALSVVGVVGGLGTPFLLYTDAGSLPGLVAYTLLIATGATAMYVRKGWRSLLGAATTGTWLVLLVGLVNFSVVLSEPEGLAEASIMQLGLTLSLLLFWLTPVARAALRARSPERWPEPPAPILPRSALIRHYAALPVFTSPFVFLALSVGTWPSADGDVWGALALTLCGLYAATSRLLDQRQLSVLARTHRLAAAFLGVIGLAALLDDGALLVALAAEAVLLVYLAGRLSDRALHRTALGLFLALGFTVMFRLLNLDAGAPVVFNGQALADLTTLALAAGAGFFLVTEQRARQAFALVCHVLLLLWLHRELSALPSGQAYVTIAWGLYAVALLVMALRHSLPALHRVALATLLLTIGKLFLVDLSRLETIWRILIFLGFGAALLLLSYLVPGLLKTPRSEQEAQEQAA